MKLSVERKRLLIAGGLFAAVILAYVFRLLDMQVVNGESYLQTLIRGSSRTQAIQAARGEIVDRYGRPLAYNQTGFDILFDRAQMPYGRENEIIGRSSEILSSLGEEWIDDLPVTRQAPFAYTEGHEGDVARLKKFLELGEYATAADALYWLGMRYGLDGEDEETLRLVAGVRYTMEQRGFSLSAPYTFAKGVLISTATYIKQMSFDLPGTDVQESAVRAYEDGSLMPHILGTVGPIYTEEYAAYKEKGYARNELVGKDGIEKAFEDELRGTAGRRRIYLDAAGNVEDVAVEEAAVPGNTISLTIDKGLQKVAGEALEKQIEYLQRTAKEGQGKEANAGAVAVLDVKTGEVLALVSYPSYDLGTYSKNYAALSADERHPLFNRALSGTYAPGSTFKPVVGIAGLNEGVITPSTVVTCRRVYTFLSTYQPTCLSYHGPVTLRDALRVSCNIFFYDTGRQLGIQTINRYAGLLGLGVPTGIQLPEKTGQLNNPDSDRPGDVLQASIGQLDNRFTPLQLANYAATIANRGKRMQASIIRCVHSYNFDRLIYENDPQVAAETDIPAEIFETVIQGMVDASRIGTASATFGNYPITVASKTGTPETTAFPNSTFIAFAPAEDPQIAVAVVIEKGWHGYTGAPVAKAVFDAYFFSEAAAADALPQGSLLP
jgi:penicillin-binding protein 2